RKAAQFASTGLSIEQAKEELIAETISVDLNFYGEIIELHAEMERYVSSATKADDIASYYRVGAIIQSGLIASLFLMFSGAYAQTSSSLNSKLEKQLLELVYKPDSKRWDVAKKEL